jgi:hypothetical protein
MQERSIEEGDIESLKLDVETSIHRTLRVIQRRYMNCIRVLALLRSQRLFVMLGQYLLAQLDVLVLCLLLGSAGVDDLLPLVVFGLALGVVSTSSLRCRCVAILLVVCFGGGVSAGGTNVEVEIW